MASWLKLSNWFPVGMGGKQLIFISVFFDFERIERCFYQLQKNSVFINLYPLHLTEPQESTLKGKNITVHNFISVFENNWVLPMGTEAENADAIIDVKAKQLSFKGGVTVVIHSASEGLRHVVERYQLHCHHAFKGCLWGDTIH